MYVCTSVHGVQSADLGIADDVMGCVYCWSGYPHWEVGEPRVRDCPQTRVIETMLFYS